jgi:hypothetical protein
MKEKEQMTAAEIAAKRIREMPLSKHYKPVDDLPIPLHKGVLILKPRHVNPALPVTTSSGIIVDPRYTSADNTEDLKEGILMAVGPNCTEYLRIGLRYQFSSYVDTFFHHKGEVYYKLDEPAVYYVIPSDETVVNNGIKKEKAVRRVKSLEKQSVRQAAERRSDLNEKDRRMDKTAGKTRKLK